MPKKNIFIVFLLLAPFLAVSQQEKLTWDKTLTWDNFKGKPNRSSPYYANTNAGISYTWSYKKGEFKYEVIAYFYPYESWVKKGNKSDSLLKHEQLHFDISELYARKLRKQLAIYAPTKYIQREMNKIYSSIEKAQNKMQQIYDKETRHGTFPEAQEKWNLLVAKELRESESFK